VVRLFVVLFGRAAFLPNEQGETFHQLALREGKRWEARVARDLSETVFAQLFPELAGGRAAADPARPAIVDAAYLEALRQGALVLLYRLLFVLYAEDRNLLPDENGPYAPYCLTRIRQEVAEHAGRPWPKGVVTLWPRLGAIFRAIADGNDDLGIPAYDGGLFDRAAAPILDRVQLPDAALARVILGSATSRATAADRNTSTIATSRCSSSAPSMRESWSTAFAPERKAGSRPMPTARRGMAREAITRRTNW